MAEGDVHRHLKKIALHFLKSKVIDLVCNEVDFVNSYSIADAVGLNFKRKEVRVVEVKATKGDFVRDKKLFDEKTSYFYHAHYSYIMCPVGVIKPEEVPYGYGLLWVDDHDQVETVKNPIKNKARLKTLFETTMKRTAKQLTNQMLYKDENQENKDITSGVFSRSSIIKYVAARCSGCKKVKKDLINIHETKVLKCKCGTEIDLSKAKIREITGYNQAFINKINKLNGAKK